MQLQAGGVRVEPAEVRVEPAELRLAVRVQPEVGAPVRLLLLAVLRLLEL